MWVESGVGRLLPSNLWRALVDRLTEPGGQTDWDLAYLVEPLDGVELVVGPGGTTLREALPTEAANVECPEPPELTARW